MSPKQFRAFFVSTLVFALVIAFETQKAKPRATVPTVEPTSTPQPVPTQTSSTIYDNTDTFIGSIPTFTAAFTMHIFVNCGSGTPKSLQTFFMNINQQNYKEVINQGELTFTRPYGTYTIHIANGCNTRVVVVRV